MTLKTDIENGACWTGAFIIAFVVAFILISLRIALPHSDAVRIVLWILAVAAGVCTLLRRSPGWVAVALMLAAADIGVAGLIYLFRGTP